MFSEPNPKVIIIIADKKHYKKYEKNKPPENSRPNKKHHPLQLQQTNTETKPK